MATAALAGFPRLAVLPHESLWRITQSQLGPWWFSSSGEGRFDLRSPHGTCYTAADPAGALLEVVGPDRTGGALCREFFDARRLHELHVDRPHALAHLAARPSASFGITAEISTLVPYDLPQAWAAALHRAGADGVAYALRHDPEGSLGCALFGEAGAHPELPVAASSSIPEALLAGLGLTASLVVLPRPRLDQLQLVEPPGSH